MSAHAHRGHGHAHGRVDPSILRSRAGLRAVLISLAVLGATAAAQAVVFVLSGSVALLADLIHNAGDALTAVPVGAAFLLRSARAERWAGYVVVLVILFSACVALWETAQRFLHPREIQYLWALAAAGLAGAVGNEVAAQVRIRAGRRLHSAALVADGNHARVDAFVSLGVVASAAAVALGARVADPLIGLAITLVILRITWQSWRTVRGGDDHGRTEHGHVIHWARRYDLRLAVRALGRERALRREQVTLARLAPGERVLDVGCGTGGLAIEAKRTVGSEGAVHGVDAAREMVALARRKARRGGVDVAFDLGIAQELPFPDASFDAVLMTLVLHQLPGDDLVRALAETRRVLAPGGRLLVVDIAGTPTGRRRTPHGHGRWDVDEVVAPLLGAAGLQALGRGAVAFRLRRFEDLRYVLAGSAGPSSALVTGAGGAVG